MKLKKMAEISPGDGIGSIREFLFESVIALFCILGLLAVIMGGVEAFLQGKWKIVFIYIIAYLPLLTCFVCQRKIAYHYRVIIVLLDVYILSVVVLAGIGLSGAGIPLLITFSVLTTTFLGIRMGIASVLMSVASILMIGSGMSTGILPVDMALMANSTRIESWAMAAFLYLLIGGIMVACPGILQNGLQRTIDIIQEKTVSLQESNNRLKKALKDRQEMEAKLIRAEKLEAMGLLAAGVAHDLNNILTGVTTYPELLLLNMSKENALYGPMNAIKSSGDKAVTIVRDLLTLSRRGVNEKEILDVTAIVQACLQSPEYEALLELHPDISVDIHLDENMAHIAGSVVHLYNVIMNLIANAAEAMAQGGKIHITAQNRVLENDVTGYETIPKGEYVTLRVADTGSGIAADDLDKIFEPFFTRKKMGRSGTGLGMSIVLGSVKDHHGYIDIETSENKGTHFILYFPATKEALPAKPESSELDTLKGRGQLILLVDDVKVQRTIGETVLRNLGYTPICMDSGEKAIEFCQAEKPDLMIVDMIMDPGIDGYETLKAIRDIHPDLYAIIVSGYSETDRVKAALELGSSNFIKKPYAIEDFAMALHMCLNRYPYQSSALDKKGR
ncbi:ATP-binding protein [Desulfobacula sp.]|uniref:hybrid sensor histidine kinase/response regulator n=1 Tax=Desulfobacula sp. TaxID=2593537 RepID=UPI00260B3294|nr:ATP-binding protein [Desulfobacula sp.]